MGTKLAFAGLSVCASFAGAACGPPRAPGEAAEITVPLPRAAAPPVARSVPLATPARREGELLREGGRLPGGDENIGASAPGFVLNTIDPAGKTGPRLGNVTVIHFWATWCEPCKRTFVDLEKLYEARKDEGLVVIAISVDDELDGVADFAKTHGATFPVVWDTGHKVTDRYQPRSMPTTYVVDRQGLIRFQHFGFRDPEDRPLADEVKTLL